MPTIRDELQTGWPDLLQLLDQRDGAALLIPKLAASTDPKSQEHVWDLCAQFYSSANRHHEALSIYCALYAELLKLQEAIDPKFADGARIHKGTPLVRIADEHAYLRHAVLSKRYVMLTMCEDAIAYAGKIPPETTGSYYRLVWHHGLSPDQLTRYASLAYTLWRGNENESRFPEWILPQLDQEWMTEYPTVQEAATYVANTTYIKRLLSQMGNGDGMALERLAHYVLSCVPGFRARMRTRSHSTDYDVICANEGPSLDFRSELGRYFLCECKDWEKPADVTSVVKFASVLRSAKCCFGLLFSKNGITGENNQAYAERELLKIFQHDNLTILVVSNSDLDQIAKGTNFLALLRTKYEISRLDLPKA